ncbi:CPBP family intramembrane glutamic endopeptidase [Kallotenue papyrolyticum]|uniref:CPBP family intramembrane glutamic endopeptidase n=1 Tax=Kallotenue papyrolyticum TaxID=1325125 RepID=UPI000492AD95|nr:CPBP family intramembrane glutamic endopeptidase [Kallotenue papyrolyticum]
MQMERASRSARDQVRWTLSDLLGVALLTLTLAAGMLLLLRLPALAGLPIAALARQRPLLVGMILGGLIYLGALLATELLIVRRGRGSWRAIGFRAPPLLLLLLTPLIFAGQLTALLLVNALLLLLGRFENPQIDALTDPGGFAWSNFVAVFVVGALIAPIVEETLFRGLLYQWLRQRVGVIAAVLLSAALFALAHYLDPRILPLLPALFVVGVILALAFEWAHSLWVPIALHCMQNALGICGIFYLQAHPELLRTA